MGELTHAITQVGRGVTKARPLSGEEAGAAMAAILSGKADPFELGAFLVAMRIKEETAEELTAFTREAQARLAPVPGPSPEVTVPSYAGKRQTYPALLAAACMAAACGVRVGLHGHARPVGRMSLADAVAALGGNPFADPEQAAGDLERAGVAYVGVERFLPVMHDMLELRQRMGLRSCFHTMARLVNPFRAANQVVGISHERTFEKFSRACHDLGYRRVLSFRGLEGEAEANAQTPTEGMMLGEDGAVATFPIDPGALGIARAGRSGLAVANAREGSEMVHRVLAGEGPDIARDTAALTAACLLLAAGKAEDLADGFRQARGALADQSARGVLERWLKP